MTDQESRSALEACGSTGPLILGVEEPGTSSFSWRVFDRQFVVVGRDPGSDLVLQDPALSRRHAYFQVIAGRLFCVDLQSRTGTHWGEEPGLWGWVDPDGGVRVGPFRIRPRQGLPGSCSVGKAGGSMLPVPVSRSFEQPELEEMTLEFAGRTSGSATWRASRALILIGRAPSCKLRLVGGEVAAIHAAILRTPAGNFAIDLLGPGGIIVNGRRTRCAQLRQGDDLRIGGHAIRVRRGSGEALASTARPIDTPARVPVVGEDTASLVGAMLGEFGRMQDQTAERLQATLMAVVQSFVGIHQEQMALIGEELGRIRALSEEQTALRLHVEGQARAIAGPPALRLVAGEARTSTGRPAPDLAGRSRPPSPSQKLTIDERDQAGPEVGRKTSPASGPRPLPTGITDDGEFHARVFDRLAEIQGERQGRWQKLMESLLGPAS